MGFFSKKAAPAATSQALPIEKGTPADTPSTQTPCNQSPATRSLASVDHQNDTVDVAQALEKQPVTFFAILLGAIASIGGFIFGYESGQISGLSQQPQFSYIC
jgi:SP family sugar:H+ symporter-like MFS transporter